MILLEKRVEYFNMLVYNVYVIRRYLLTPPLDVIRKALFCFYLFIYLFYSFLLFLLFIYLFIYLFILLYLDTFCSLKHPSS